jgi:ribosomal protein S18 acetylase RimI-like enzyme
VAEAVMLRRASTEDREAIADLFALHLRSLGYAPDPELDRDMLDPMASYDSFLVAELRGSLVAMGGVARGEIRRIFVLPEHRRHRLAARLVAELVSDARNRGEREIRAIVADSNSPARRLFTSLGFRPTGRTPDHEQMKHCEIFDGSEACKS